MVLFSKLQRIFRRRDIFSLPMVKRVYPTFLAKQLVSVQPMQMPTGNIFYLDFGYGGHSALVRDILRNFNRVEEILGI